jgi:hypothetical protein
LNCIHLLTLTTEIIKRNKSFLIAFRLRQYLFEMRRSPKINFIGLPIDKWKVLIKQRSALTGKR